MSLRGVKLAEIPEKAVRVDACGVPEELSGDAGAGCARASPRRCRLHATVCGAGGGRWCPLRAAGAGVGAAVRGGSDPTGRQRTQSARVGTGSTPCRWNWQTTSPARPSASSASMPGSAASPSLAPASYLPLHSAPPDEIQRGGFTDSVRILRRGLLLVPQPL